MKVAYLVGARRFELRELPEPVAPKGGLVMDVIACGVCGSDLRRYREGPDVSGKEPIPGHEAAGVVIETGGNLDRFRVGDRITIVPDIHCGHCYYCRRGMFNLCDDLRLVGITPGYPGGMAEKLVLPPEVIERGIVNHIPEGMPFEHATLAEPSGSVLSAHQRAGTALGDTVVVMGAGPIGCIHTAVAKSRGARVIISEPNENRRKTAAVFEPDLIVDPFKEDLKSRVDAVTNGVGADVVICANPVKATQSQAIKVVRKAGRVVLFGGVPKSDPITGFNSNIIHYGEIEVVGAFSFHPVYHELALDVINRGLIPAEKLITHSFPLNQINEAFETAASGKGLKVIVKPQGETK